jgi:transposase
MLEAPDLGNEDGVMPKEQSPGKPTTRRYSPEEKAAAVRMVRTLRAELGTEHGTVHRVARQLGYGIESVRSWVRRADIDDGFAPGVSTSESQRVRHLEQEIRELKRANEILKAAAIFFGAELCATRRRVCREVVRDHLCWAVAAA